MAASGLLRERDLRVLTAVVEDALRDDTDRVMIAERAGSTWTTAQLDTVASRSPRVLAQASAPASSTSASLPTPAP